MCGSTDRIEPSHARISARHVDVATDTDQGVPLRAIVNGTVIAESDTTVVVEGNHYFPPASLQMEHFTATERTTVCSWKGTANYFTLQVGDTTLDNAAWVYREPKDAAAEIRDHVAFYPSVTIET